MPRRRHAAEDRKHRIVTTTSEPEEEVLRMDSAEPTIAFGNHMSSRIAGELVVHRGLRGRFVFDRTGRHVGRLADLVVRLDTVDAHPPIHGALVRAGAKLHYIPETAIVGIRDWNLYLCTVGLTPRTIPANDHWSARPPRLFSAPRGSPDIILPAASTPSGW
jgi:hypothetical protein